MKHQRIGVLLLRTSCTGSAVVTNGTFCSLPPDTTESTGVSCFGIFTKYFFNETVEKCEEYVYGGCGATLNNFDTKEECDKAAETYCLEDENDGKEEEKEEEEEATSLQGQDMIEQSAAASFSFELTTMRYFVALHVLLLYASVF